MDGPEHCYYLALPPQVARPLTGDLSDLFIFPDDDRKKFFHNIPRVKALAIAMGELAGDDIELDRLHARAQAMQLNQQQQFHPNFQFNPFQIPTMQPNAPYELPPQFADQQQAFDQFLHYQNYLQFQQQHQQDFHYFHQQQQQEQQQQQQNTSSFPDAQYVPHIRNPPKPLSN